MFLYFHALLPYFSQSELKYRGDEVRIFSLSRDKKVHILCHGGSVKVGVKPKLNFSEKKKTVLVLTTCYPQSQIFFLIFLFSGIVIRFGK